MPSSKTDRVLADVGMCDNIVSQFTLYASTRKGSKPDFHAAMVGLALYKAVEYG